MRFKITAPVPHVVSTVAGVAFADSVGHTDSDAAVAYFKRHGYRVEEIPDPEPEPEEPKEPAKEPKAPFVPNRGSTKAEWVAFVSGPNAPEGKALTEDEAKARTRDQLAEHVLGPKED